MSQSISRTLDNLAQRWAGADVQTLRPMFSLVVEGRPLGPEEIAARLGIPAGRVKAALQFPTIGTDEKGDLVELFGLRLQPSWHRVDVDGNCMFACCALVAHAVPAMIDKAVRIVSVDPLGRGFVELVVDRYGISSTEPKPACATLPASAGPWQGNSVADEFCSHVRHFPSRDRAEEFAAGDPRRRVVDLDAFHAHAVATSDRVFGPSGTGPVLDSCLQRI